MEDNINWIIDENYIDRAHFYRGKIISQFCFLEMTMSMIMTESFISDRELGNQMYQTMLERMTFENKRASFQAIIYSRAPENKIKYKHIFRELSELNELRNQFAHYPLIPTIADWDNETGIGLAKFRDKPNAIKFKVDELDDILARINKIDYLLNREFRNTETKE
ncbi:hypothetical protein WG904_17540 [Pedobacter sp. Du54]|uniref:hypothetical protein n=1 Tax=Pedobacter anseongensis TaxID=3133439 RepID=UPI0030AE19FB